MRRAARANEIQSRAIRDLSSLSSRCVSGGFCQMMTFFFFVRLFFLSFIQLCCFSFEFTNVHRWAEKKMVLCLRAAGYKKVFYKLLGALLCFLFFNASSIISIFVSLSPSVVARNGAVLWFWCRSTPQVPFNQPYDCWISSFTHERKRAPFFSSLKDFSVRPPAPPLTPPLVLLNINPVFLGGLISTLYLSVFTSNLLSNPYVCDCHLTWLGQWLKKTRVVSGNPRCQKPAFLKEIPIQDVAAPDFTCDSKSLPCACLCWHRLHRLAEGPEKKSRWFFSIHHLWLDTSFFLLSSLSSNLFTHTINHPRRMCWTLLALRWQLQTKHCLIPCC